MTDYTDQFINAVTGEYFAPIINLSYILMKIILRHIIHKAIDHDYDFWGVIAWFSVDITLLSLSVCAAANVTANHFSHRGSIFWYLTFIFFFIIAAFCYLFFVKRRNKLDKGKKNKKDKVRPYKDWRLSLYLSTGWFIGFACFWATLRALR